MLAVFVQKSPTLCKDNALLTARALLELPAWFSLAVFYILLDCFKRANKLEMEQQVTSGRQKSELEKKLTFQMVLFGYAGPIL